MVNTIFAKAVEESSINHASVLLLLLLLKFASVFLLGGRSIFAYPLVAAGRASSHNWSGLPVKVLPQSRESVTLNLDNNNDVAKIFLSVNTILIDKNNFCRSSSFMKIMFFFISQQKFVNS